MSFGVLHSTLLVLAIMVTLTIADTGKKKNVATEPYSVMHQLLKLYMG